MSSRNLASFASTLAISAEPAALAPGTAPGLSGFGGGAFCARSPPPVNANAATRTAALAVIWLNRMGVNAPSVKEDTWARLPGPGG